MSKEVVFQAKGYRRKRGSYQYAVQVKSIFGYWVSVLWTDSFIEARRYSKDMAKQEGTLYRVVDQHPEREAGRDYGLN